MTGIPWEVPVPRKVTFNLIYFELKNSKNKLKSVKSGNKIRNPRIQVVGRA
jgi:hypothetical protein